jgi:N,N-dimethylformamidase beta subunit-like protein
VRKDDVQLSGLFVTGDILAEPFPEVSPLRTRLAASTAILFLVVGLVLAVFLIGPGVIVNGRGTQTQSYPPELSSTQYNPILRENAQRGTSTWRIPPGKAATTEIQAYASATSVPIEHFITFYVSTQRAGTPYTISIYRIGWYNGLGGRLMAPPVQESGQAQGYYGTSLHLGIANHLLKGCTSCIVDTKTGLVEADWRPSYKLYVPTDWTTGVYLAKFTGDKGMQTYVPFDVVGNLHSLAVVVTPDTTYQAYNTWGGYSLYSNDLTSSANSETDTSVGLVVNGVLTRAVKVSFDRPYVQDAGSAQVLEYEADVIHWLEKKGYDISYISDVDVQNDPAQLLNHTAYLSIGHDEYWTKEMRDGVEYARDHGVGLAFLGADAAYWQMRFEPDSQGAPNRTVVCYKVDSSYPALINDPLYGQDNSRVTSRWRDPIVGRPENALIGIMYASLTHQVPGFPWQLSPTTQSPLLSATELQVGRHYGCALVGYEWDSIYNNGATPPGLTVLGASQTLDNYGVTGVSNTTYFIAKSGAMVFATGSMSWTAALDNYRYRYNSSCAGQDHAVPQMQQLLENVFRELGVRHPSGQLFPLAVSGTAPVISSLSVVFSALYRSLPLLPFYTRRFLTYA